MYEPYNKTVHILSLTFISLPSASSIFCPLLTCGVNIEPADNMIQNCLCSTNSSNLRTGSNKNIGKWQVHLLSWRVEPLIVRETQMRPFCGLVEIAPHPSPLLPTRGRAMTSGAPGLGSAQPIQARRHFVARFGPAVAWSIRSYGTPVAFL